MDIKAFLNTVEPTIIERGKDLWGSGAVVEFGEERPGQWYAEVMGSRLYKVELAVETGADIKSGCDCPFSAGPVCKHIVAASLAIREDLEKEQFAEDTGSPQRLLRQLSFADQVKKIGESVEKEDLLRFISETAYQDRNLRDRFLLHFAEQLGMNREAHWRKVINLHIRQVRKGQPYLRNQACDELSSELYPLIHGQHPTEDLKCIREILLEELRELQKSAEDYEGHLEALIAEVEGLR